MKQPYPPDYDTREAMSQDTKPPNTPRRSRCWGCDCIADDVTMTTVDVEEYGEHTTKEICEECAGDLGPRVIEGEDE